MKVIIFGAGRVGASFGYLLHKAGHHILGVKNNSLGSAQKAVKKMGAGQPLDKDQLSVYLKQADLVVITTPDDKIEKIAKMVQKYDLKAGVTLMQMSGLLASDVLNRKGKDKVNVFSLHPLQSIPGFSRGIETLPGAVYTLEGDEGGKKRGEKLCTELGLNYYHIKKELKPLYHISAVMSANYLVTLIQASYDLLASAGLENEDMKHGIRHLVQGVLDNLEEKDPKDALTGPLARGDRDTIKKHLQNLEKYRTEYLELYKVLGKHTVDLVGSRELFADLLEDQEN